MTKALNELSITEAAHALRARECTVRELFDTCIVAAKEKNPGLNAYLELFDDEETSISILAAQKSIDADIENGATEASQLCGIPLAIKDNILIEGRIASASSKMLANYRATYDATIIKKLKAEGAIFIGRTNMDEFALGGSTENSAFGPTMNPHDSTRVAGGTSGGSAAAVAADIAIASVGTDTGGSVRNPASYCGVVGFKPTYGGVSRSGLIAAASSFDQAGPITKTVADAKILFNAIRGNDPLDSSTAPDGFYEKIQIAKEGSVKKEVKTIGVPLSMFETILEKDVLDTFLDTLKKLEEQGIKIVYDLDMELAQAALAVYYIINFAEVSTNLSRFDGMRYGLAERGSTLLDDYVLSRSEGFGPESKRRIMLGTYVLSSGYYDAYYRKAVEVRKAIIAEFDELFKSVDVIATPTMPSPAFRIGEKSDPLSLYLEDIFTVTANLTGMPAISVPMGMVARTSGSDSKELPIGIHFTAPRGADDLLFTVASKVTS
jgi:aspartyl-tRNA(Asn)/glutamyl-tRNA(Gln) amidotransferase subunit A